MKQYILFDNDGVLVDTEYWYFKATQRALGELGVTLEKNPYLQRMVRGESSWDLALAALPWFKKFAWMDIEVEYDPYKYNSFATNAAAQVHQITHHVDGRIQSLASNAAVAGRLPPILAIKSTVDATVTTDAVVDNLLIRLPANRNELLLFDINRQAAIKSTLLVDDPGPLTKRLLNDAALPFAVTMVTNEDAYSQHVVARRKPAYLEDGYVSEPLQLQWPAGVVSLSHVALPFPPDDPVYGESPVEGNDQVFLGNLAIKGERGLLRIPGEWLLRQRHNPFYDYMQARIVAWLNDAGAVHGGVPPAGVGQ